MMVTIRDLPRAGRYDAVIIGGRVAGAATALLLARSGLSVLVVDRARYGSDTLSTHALTRGGVLQLERWGLLPAVIDAGTPAATAVSFHYGDDVLAVPIKSRDGVTALFAPRRTVLDSILVDHAAAAGADMVFGPRFVDVRRDANGRICGVTIEARDGRAIGIDAGLVIGADGMTSAVADRVGASTYRSGGSAAGLVYAYWTDVDVAPSQFHWYFTPGLSAGVIPTNGGICIFAGTSADRFVEFFRGDREAGYFRILDGVSAALGTAVRRANRTETFRGFAGHVGFLRQCAGPGWALVGDAGYFKDPITAHGLTDALRDAELLTAAVLSGTDEAIEAYQRQRDTQSLDLFQVTDEIASYTWTFDRIRELHQALSRAMAQEARVMATRGPLASRRRGATEAG